MSLKRRLQRWMVQHGLGFLVPLYYAQENFHHATVYLFVSRFGVKRWELYRFKPGTGSDEFDRKMRPLKFGTVEWYSRLQNLCDMAGDCVRIGPFKTWSEASAASLK